MAKDPRVLDQLRREIQRAEKKGITRYRLSKLTGVGQATLSGFMAGRLQGLRVSTLESLAEALGFRIVLEKAD